MGGGVVVSCNKINLLTSSLLFISYIFIMPCWLDLFTIKSANSQQSNVLSKIMQWYCSEKKPQQSTVNLYNSGCFGSHVICPDLGVFRLF